MTDVQTWLEDCLAERSLEVEYGVQSRLLGGEHHELECHLLGVS